MKTNVVRASILGSLLVLAAACEPGVAPVEEADADWMTRASGCNDSDGFGDCAEICYDAVDGDYGEWYSCAGVCFTMYCTMEAVPAGPSSQ